MNGNHYIISYSPPVTVRDEPHRTVDTLDGWNGVEEIAACDYGVISEGGQTFDLPVIDLIASTASAGTDAELDSVKD